MLVAYPTAPPHLATGHERVKQKVIVIPVGAWLGGVRTVYGGGAGRGPWSGREALGRFGSPHGDLLSLADIHC